MKGYFSSFKRAIVALSGGADSSYVLYLAAKYLGQENVLAFTMTNKHVFSYEVERSKKIADLLAVKWVGADVEMDERFFRNDEDRCYYCKRSLLKFLRSYKEENCFDVIFDGSNVDDLNEVRPGRKALEEFGVRSPLLENGLGKKDVIVGIKETPLKDMPFYTESCLATRFVGVPFDDTIMILIELMEDYLRDRIPGLRIRWDGKKIYKEIKKIS
ncbi:MAG: 7-cyano-7-deazaguanine synthase [Calditerrivibrio sp.]|nr:7-cyano-7-deazaguanine synthase [Calditerrivibrio sp.]